MNTSLHIAMIQTDLYWKDKVANLAMLEEKIWGIEEEVDLIVLPEMFPTGFSMDAEELAEPMNLTVCKWMKQMASQKKAVVCGSAIVVAGGEYFNRFLWAQPSGEIQFYDKRHLFRMAEEHDHFSAGQSQPVFEWKGWKILPQVCYDLRFPIWSRNQHSDEGMAFDLMLYIASWPAPRASAWDILLPARAVENLAYAIGVNRVGIDGNQIPYVGHSAVYDFKGNAAIHLGEDESIGLITLHKEELLAYREKFPAWMDADDFEIRNRN
ncbi:amidohydrolase [Algoriphagus vanfongensis]|uniref:amidohydrolase n=1 Tax=Algoriphagus vanfongensis TaxID=426371 RepID=UPI0004786C38|nr:amidohydrolase [Algoriphagus vanfongensis]